MSDYQSESLTKLAPDLVALQADLEPLTKTANNPFFKSKYAPLPDVAEALKPLLAKHHFSLPVIPTLIDTPTGPTNGLRFILLHKSGEYLSGVWMLNPAQSTPQGEGADTTYKRRFGIQAITGMVADDDDDGHAASFRPAPEVVGKRPKQPVQPPAKPTEADLKREELKKLAAEKGWTLAAVAAAYANSITDGDGKAGELRTATADDVEAFMVSLETGVVTV